MKYLDLTLPTPAENLACDETLLDWCEAGHCPEGILRFWEPADYFVVAGYANKAGTEVNVAACEARGIPILRRCSGGGTVVQGPGCLNYALILRIHKNGPLASIQATNRFIMERNCVAIASSIQHPVSGIAVCGHTDLAIDKVKFSGNSQRRRRHFLLFHGTFLLNFNLNLIDELLPMPSQQPGYRRNRSHKEFLANLPMAADEVKTALRSAWNARTPFKDPPLEAITALARERYTSREWNFKF